MRDLGIGIASEVLAALIIYLATVVGPGPVTLLSDSHAYLNVETQTKSIGQAHFITIRASNGSGFGFESVEFHPQLVSRPLLISLEAASGGEAYSDPELPFTWKSRLGSGEKFEVTIITFTKFTLPSIESLFSGQYSYTGP